MDLWPLAEDSHVVERIPQILGSKSFLSSDLLYGNYHPRVMNAVIQKWMGSCKTSVLEVTSGDLRCPDICCLAGGWAEET